LVFFPLRNGVIAPSGHEFHVRAVVGAVHDKGVIGDAGIVERLQQLADILVVIDHHVVIFASPPWAWDWSSTA